MLNLKLAALRQQLTQDSSGFFANIVKAVDDINAKISAKMPSAVKPELPQAHIDEQVLNCSEFEYKTPLHETLKFIVIKTHPIASLDDTKYFLITPLQLGSGVNGEVLIAWELEIKHNSPANYSIKLKCSKPYKAKQVSYPLDVPQMQRSKNFPPNYQVMELLSQEKIYRAFGDSTKLPVETDLVELFFLPIRVGQSLTVLHEKNIQLNLTQLLVLMMRMVYLILRLHLHNVTVRDIKPSNFLYQLIKGLPQVALIDEDSMRSVGTEVAYDQAALTPYYAAPEHATINLTRKRKDSKTDFSEALYQQPLGACPSQAAMPFWVNLRAAQPEFKIEHDTPVWFDKISKLEGANNLKADMYSLGVAFAALLFGSNFFTSTENYARDELKISFQPGNLLIINDAKKLSVFVEYRQHLVDSLPPVHQNLFPPERYGELIKIIQQLLNEDPKKRYSSAECLRELACLFFDESFSILPGFFNPLGFEVGPVDLEKH